MYVQSEPDQCRISFRALPIEFLWKAENNTTKLPLDHRLKITIDGQALDNEITYPMMQSLLSCNINEWSHSRRNHYNAILLSLYVIRECLEMRQPIDEEVLLSLITECRVLNCKLTSERFHRPKALAAWQPSMERPHPKRQAVLAGESVAHYFDLSPVLAANDFDCVTVSDVNALPILNLIQLHWDVCFIPANDFSNIPDDHWSHRPDGKSIAYLIQESGAEQQDLEPQKFTTSTSHVGSVSIRTIEAKPCGDVVAIVESELSQLAQQQPAQS